MTLSLPKFAGWGAGLFLAMGFAFSGMDPDPRGKLEEHFDAEMGVLRISPPDSGPSWVAKHDTNSLNKMIMAVVTANFSLK